MAKKIQVLFICTGNSARSQMSEGLLRKVAGDMVDVYSAGVKPAAGVHPLAKRMMLENGIDPSGHYTKSVNMYLDKELDVVVTTCNSARQSCPVFPGKGLMKYHWELEDPSDAPEDQRLNAFRATFAEISERVSELVKIIEKLRDDPDSVAQNPLEIPDLG